MSYLLHPKVWILQRKNIYIYSCSLLLLDTKVPFVQNDLVGTTTLPVGIIILILWPRFCPFMRPKKHYLDMHLVTLWQVVVWGIFLLARLKWSPWRKTPVPWTCMSILYFNKYCDEYWRWWVSKNLTFSQRDFLQCDWVIIQIPMLVHVIHVIWWWS